MKNIFQGSFNRLFLLLLLAAASITATSCKKDDPEVVDYSGIDDGIIQKYLADHTITTAQKQPSGLYFLPVRTNASAPKVALGSTVTVVYTGHLLDATGTVFDATSKYHNAPFSFVVGSLGSPKGFDEGVSLMHLGDRAEFLIPSGLAYGSQSFSTIPANSVLRFEVEVVDLNAYNDALIQSYLTANNITTAQKQASGLYYVPVVTNTAGVRPAVGSTVSVLYTGTFLDGAVFDASSQHGNVPISFVLGRGQVIAGWDEGIALMRKGEKAQLLIPSNLAYGAQGAGNSIPPNAVLRFEVELTDVK